MLFVVTDLGSIPLGLHKGSTKLGIEKGTQVRIKENIREKDVFLVQPISAPVNDNLSWESISRQLMGAVEVYGQKKDRAVAIGNAGTYINITLFAIDVKTGEKKFMMKNRTILKVG